MFSGPVPNIFFMFKVYLGVISTFDIKIHARVIYGHKCGIPVRTIRTASCRPPGLVEKCQSGYNVWGKFTNAEGERRIQSLIWTLCCMQFSVREVSNHGSAIFCHVITALQRSFFSEGVFKLLGECDYWIFYSAIALPSFVTPTTTN